MNRNENRRTGYYDLILIPQLGMYMAMEEVFYQMLLL